MPRPVNFAACSRDIACVGEREMHPVSSVLPCPAARCRFRALCWRTWAPATAVRDSPAAPS